MKRMNGYDVPENLSLYELEDMLRSIKMQDFAGACEKLSLDGSQQAYEILKPYVYSKDKYRRRYVLSVIFHFPYAAELQEELLKALKSEERYFISTALDHILHKRAHVSDEDILVCFEKNLEEIGNYYCQILEIIEKSEANLDRILRMYHGCKDKSMRIAIAECLEFFSTQSNYEVLFNLLAHDEVSKMRMAACRIARKYERFDLLQSFVDDADGHIRKYVKRECEPRR